MAQGEPSYAAARNEQGFALLAVTIALAVLALIIGVVMVSAQNYVRQTADDADFVQLHAALDAGVVVVGSTLAGPMAGSSPLLSTPQTFTIGGDTVTMSVRPESSKINLSYADPKLIAALLEADGLSPEMSGRLADEIADWRDKDVNARAHGADTAAYITAGRSYTPTNAPFETISELSRILDGGADLPTCLAPDVTIYTSQPDVDLSKASARVRKAVLMVDPDRAAPSGSVAFPMLGEGHAWAGEIFEVTVTAKSAASQLSRQLVMRITGNPRDPYWILQQQTPAPSASEAHAACERFRAN